MITFDNDGENPTIKEKKEPAVLNIDGMVKHGKKYGAVGITPSFARRLINSGAIPCLKIGKAFYVTTADFNAWLASGTRKRAHTAPIRGSGGRTRRSKAR